MKPRLLAIMFLLAILMSSAMFSGECEIQSDPNAISGTACRGGGATQAVGSAFYKKPARHQWALEPAFERAEPTDKRFTHPTPVAFSGEYAIKAGPNRISGYANQIPLGQVMDMLAEKTGYAIFLDRRLDREPTSFSIPEGASPDLAVRKIVKPHGYAITFAKSGTSCRIRDIHIFQKESGPAGVDYLKYPAEQAVSMQTFPPDSSPTAGKSVRPTTRKDLVKARPAIKKDVFGAPRMKFGPADKAPDLRPTMHQMRNAHRRFMADKDAYKTKTAQNKRKQARIDFENRKKIQRLRRSQAIRQMIQSLKKGETNE